MFRIWNYSYNLSQNRTILESKQIKSFQELIFIKFESISQLVFETATLEQVLVEPYMVTNMFGRKPWHHACQNLWYHSRSWLLSILSLFDNWSPEWPLRNRFPWGSTWPQTCVNRNPSNMYAKIYETTPADGYYQFQVYLSTCLRNGQSGAGSHEALDDYKHVWKKSQHNACQNSWTNHIWIYLTTFPWNGRSGAGSRGALHGHNNVRIETPAKCT